ncbi:hypothetical protein HJG60_009570 [Phyllostomus discolor]|uniref:Uncharacterized protein n=1 Tax=Phyllostomus discolor TaxID=89673 RepID=A0A834DAL2_9CHIR|nr:hypothetical protein HJG60_009570 [Phyllostomus discolor]
MALLLRAAHGSPSQGCAWLSFSGLCMALLLRSARGSLPQGCRVVLPLSGLRMVLLLRAVQGSPPQWPPNLGFKSPRPIFLCSLISNSSHTRLHMPELVSFQLYWAAIMSLGRRGPMSWSQSSLSSHPGAVTQGTCPPPSYIWVGKLLPFPWLRADHSYLTYLCNQSKVIDMPNDHARA